MDKEIQTFTDIDFGEKNYKINTLLVTCINDHKVIS